MRTLVCVGVKILLLRGKSNSIQCSSTHSLLAFVKCVFCFLQTLAYCVALQEFSNVLEKQIVSDSSEQDPGFGV